MPANIAREDYRHFPSCYQGLTNSPLKLGRISPFADAPSPRFRAMCFFLANRSPRHQNSSTERVGLFSPGGTSWLMKRNGYEGARSNRSESCGTYGGTGAATRSREG